MLIGTGNGARKIAGTPFLRGMFLMIIWLGTGCQSPEPVKPAPQKDYIRAIAGKSDTIPQEIIDRGKVLVAYSDCATCHTEDKKFKGPAFTDIAKRYPVTDGYVELLATRVIMGGSGAWGYPVMTPHPHLSMEDARIMVKYILSLKNETP